MIRVTDISHEICGIANGTPVNESQLLVSLPWLIEYRPSPTLFFCGSDYARILLPLVCCYLLKSQTPIVMKAQLVGTEADRLETADLISPDNQAEFLESIREIRKSKRVDMVILDGQQISYSLLEQVRLSLDRLGVLIVSLPENGEIRSDRFRLMEKFVRDKKIDYVALSENHFAVFVWSWNVRLEFPPEDRTLALKKQDIALAVIAKNESHCIANMIKSVAPIISFAAILDTGSEDQTKSVVSEMLTQERIKFQIDSTDFRNFADARNRCVSMVPDSIGWILMLDADEILKADDLDKICVLIQDSEHDAWALPRLNWEDSTFTRSMSYPDRQIRLFRNVRNLHFEGAVHERLVGYRRLGWLPANVSFLGQIGGPHIHHLNAVYSKREELDAKRKRYLDLEEREKISALAMNIYNAAKAHAKNDAVGALLEINGDSETLVISCSGIVPDRVIYAMENTSAKMLTSKLFICDSRNLWYYKGIEGLTTTFDGTIHLVSCLINLIKPKKTCAIGTSGGGYIALALAARLGLDRALALSPQTNICAGWRAEHRDGRWQRHMSVIHRHLSPSEPYDIRDLVGDRIENSTGKDTEFHIIYPANEPLDVAHALRLQGLNGVNIYSSADSEHNVSADLSKRGKLGLVLDAFVQYDGELLTEQLTGIIAD